MSLAESPPRDLQITALNNGVLMRNVVQLFLAAILFCLCVNETTLAPSCDHGRSLRRLGRERFGMFTRSEYEGYEARHLMAVSGHRNESCIGSYSSQTSLSTNRKSSETLSESLNDNKTVNHSENPAAESALQPLLTEEHSTLVSNNLTHSRQLTNVTTALLTFSLKSKFSASLLMLLIIE